MNRPATLPTPASDEAGNARLMRLATYASVTTASVLIGAKLAAWSFTGSVAMLSSLIDSALDVGASLINLVAVHHALTPADREHRFGHGKAEALAGLGQSAFIFGSAILLLIEAVRRLLEPVPVQHVGWGVAAMAFSVVLTFALLRFQKYVVARTRSVAIDADSLHYMGDLLVNGSVIVSLALGALLGWSLVDPFAAVAITAYLMWSAWHIAATAFDMLMDRELPDTDRDRIRAIARAHTMVLNVHDLRTRMSGRQGFIQLHLELDANMALYQAHAIADEVETAITRDFPDFQVMIHQDPAGLPEHHPKFR